MCSRAGQFQVSAVSLRDELHHKFALKAVVGFELNLAQGTAPKQVRGHAARRQRRTEMGVAAGKYAQARTVESYQRRFPNVVFDGTEIGGAQLRSEEHTSELQSLTNLVCR